MLTEAQIEERIKELDEKILDEEREANSPLTCSHRRDAHAQAVSNFFAEASRLRRTLSNWRAMIHAH